MTKIKIGRRRKLKLPWAKRKFNVFRKQEKKTLFLNILDLKNGK